MRRVGVFPGAERAGSGVVVDHVYGGLLGARPRPVDADVQAHQVLLLVRAEALVLVDEATGPHRADLPADVLGLGRGQLVGVRLRLLLRDPLIERLALLLLGGRVAEALAGGPLLRR